MDDEHTTDRRVKFDFEVDFSNGGGLQGQNFRLDIAGQAGCKPAIRLRISLQRGPRRLRGGRAKDGPGPTRFQDGGS
jgi:hypothetical protein